VQVLELMAKREGIGDILAEGIKAAGDTFGAPELAMHSKGQGFAVYDPRGCKGMGLTYATSPKGAHHMIATTMGPEIAGNTRLSIEGKGQLQREQQFSMCIVDSISLCATMRAAVSPADQARAYEVVTGIKMDVDLLNKAAERIINLERLYNNKMGLDRKDDTLPKRFTEEKMPSGESAGHTVDLEPMLDEYYSVMGWDNNGVPTEDKLKELGLA
jgi:aldehyde:ferredoxin oxidoreductase